MGDQSFVTVEALEAAMANVKRFVDTRAGNGIKLNAETGKFDIDQATDQEIDEIITSITDILA